MIVSPDDARRLEVYILGYGMTYSQCAKVLGYTEEQVRSWARHNRLRSCDFKKRRNESVRRMILEGYESHEIKEEWGLSNALFSYLRKKLFEN